MNLIWLLLILISASPTTFTARVVSVSDGDTFKVFDGRSELRVRIDAIDAPEKKMPFGKVSKEYLATLCAGRNVKIISSKTDRYGRLLARVVLPDGRDVSTEMIRAGMAWHYVQYSSDKKLAALQQLARRKKLGLWRDPKPVPPWEYRKMKRTQAKKKRARATVSG